LSLCPIWSTRFTPAQPHSDELSRVDAAIRLGRELEGAADRVVDHFVGEARNADCSWTAIAQLLGVSKQTAVTK
jgi:hypothetical protein